MTINKTIIASKPAFLILAHADPVMFKRLVQKLKDVGDVYAHIDFKANFDHFKCDGVKFTNKRINIRWAGFSMVDATLELLNIAYSTNPNSSHYVLLSGADYPLASNSKIRAFFKDSVGHSHIKFVNMRTGPLHYWKLLRRRSFRDKLGTRGASVCSRLIRKTVELCFLPFPKCFPNNLIPCFGSSWWTLTPDCVSYVLNEVQQNKFWVEYWKDIASPDEQFFHTIIANSPLINKTDGFVKIQERGLWQLQNIHHIDKSLSKTYTINDWDEISLSHQVFLRKLDSIKSHDLLDRLDSLNK